MGSRQLWVTDHIEFRGGAALRPNVKGPMMEQLVHFHDHFLYNTLATDLYTNTNAGTSDELIVSAAVGGQCRFKTGTGNSETMMLCTSLNWEDDMYARCEARIKLATVANTHMFFGFADATTYATPITPIDYDGGTVANGATTAAGFVCDADYESSSILCDGVGATVADSGIDWADGVWHNLRMELFPDAYANYYIDGVSVARVEDAIAVSGTALCMMLCVSTRDTGGKYVYLDRWDAWQNQGE